MSCLLGLQAASKIGSQSAMDCSLVLVRYGITTLRESYTTRRIKCQHNIYSVLSTSDLYRKYNRSVMTVKIASTYTWRGILVSIAV